MDADAHDAQPSDENATDMSRSNSSNTNQTKPVDAEATMVQNTESQPMTSSNSNSSDPLAIDGVVGSGEGSAAPYGTRSRNRTGAARPNYAEDKEIDTEFEMAVSSTESRKSNRGGDAGTPTGSGKSANNARKNQMVDEDQMMAAQGLYREPIPGTSAFSSTPPSNAPAGQPSRKRKANGSSAANNSQSQHLGNGAAMNHRASMAAQGYMGTRETNMLSFEKCGSRLKNKKLVADDGTVLEVNGQLVELHARISSS